jgi:ElaB/YqjD/DUF883 family membrane-anchored ribosome-binding protein
MANETLVPLPTKFKDFKQIRTFLVKLIEKLDVILGYRGNSGYESASSATATNELTLAALSEALEDLSKEFDAVDSKVNTISEDTDQYKSGVAVIDLSYTAPTASAVYDQAELQGVMDQLQTTSERFDELLSALRGVEIIE